MKKIKIYIFFLCIIINFKAYATDAEFEEWKKKFQSIALERGVSLNTIENTVGKSIFLNISLEETTIKLYCFKFSASFKSNSKSLFPSFPIKSTELLF